jgi:PAS domain S-box-containing protein
MEKKKSMQQITHLKGGDAVPDLKFLESLLQAMTEGLYVIGADGKCKYCNPAAVNLLGYQASEFLEVSIHQLIHHSHPDGSLYHIEDCPLYRALKDGRVHSSSMDVFWRKDGSSFPVSYTSVPLSENGQVTGALVTFRDLTVEHQLKEALDDETAKSLQMGKLAALGEMAGGIAHEINTPLGVISLLSEQIQDEIQSQSLDRSIVGGHLETIIHTTHRIHKIIQSLRTISRDAAEERPSLVKVQQIAENTLTLCQERFSEEGIAVRVEIEPIDLEILCNQIQISQILLNLIGNARDAVATTKEKWIRVEAKQIGLEKVKFSIIDSGNGVPNNLEKKIFQPFFTTKEIGKGMGLGLSVSHSLVKNHGGILYLDRNCQHTCFSFELSLKKPEASFLAKSS